MGAGNTQFPERDRDTVTFAQFTGLRNDTTPERFELGDLVVADNIDIDKTGRIKRRAGYTRLLPVNAHSLWADEQQEVCLFVTAGQLRRLVIDTAPAPAPVPLPASTPGEPVPAPPAPTPAPAPAPAVTYAAITGVQAVTATGTMSAPGTTVVALSGTQAAGAVGSAAGVTFSRALTGARATGTVGTVRPPGTTAVALSGVQAAGAAGAASVAPGTTAQPILFASRADGAYPNGTLPTAVLADPAGAALNLANQFKAMYDAHFATSLSGCPGGMGPRKGDGFIVSEGVGYWMLLCAVFYGIESNPIYGWGARKTPKQMFDGCLTLARARWASQLEKDSPNSPYVGEAKYLMAWRVKDDGSYYPTGDTQNPYDAYAAPDGDLDIAQALLMGERQWPGNGYGAQATGTINALKHWCYRTDGTLIAIAKPEGFYGYTDGDKPAAAFTLVRTSDFMFNHYRSFARHTQDKFWMGGATTTQGRGNAYDRALALMKYIQDTLSPSTGLMPDFLEGTETDTPYLPQDRLGHGDPGLIVQITDNPPYNNYDRYPTPADIARGVPTQTDAWGNPFIPYNAALGGYVYPSIEDKFDTRGKYFDSNACRVPLRVITDWLFSGNPDLLAAILKHDTFIASKMVGNDPTLIQDSYRIDTGAATDYASTGEFAEVLGPAMAGMMASPSFQAKLDALWSWNTGGLGGRNDSGYYAGELQLIPKLVAAGLWWEPKPNGALP